MISLFLDTSYHNLILSIFEGKREIYHLEEESNHDLSTKLLPEIEKAFSSCNLDIQHLNTIYVVNGPGSFTGVRIGVTVAKTLAWALEARLIPVSELELLASTKIDSKYVVPLMDARRDAVYAGMYSNLESVIPDQYIDRATFLNLVTEKAKEETVTFVSFDTFSDVEVFFPQVDAQKIIERHQNDQGVEVHTLIPNYLKRTEAEEKEVMIREIKDYDIPFVETCLEHVFDATYVESDVRKTLVFEDQEIVGFIQYTILYERAEIEYIYVQKTRRNEHIASQLMEEFLIDVKKNGVNTISLEVSEENQEAISLYKKYGFKIMLTREKYYHGKDAYLMVREVK